tara:strand:+ start:807 stop:1832 length:1026 start_codon:yes stop_codon:yes gene_type:complete
MYKNDKNIHIIFINWLKVSLFLVFSIIIVGGLTRLTDSGLSITQWELFKGILPPLNENTWSNYFELYKQIPQYRLINYNMNIEEFKVIFYWEYIHRNLGRFIGLFFLIPLIYFHFTKKIEKKYLNICNLILLLIIIQGAVGWLMVKSGLINVTTVSHYRLSIHLSVALIIISLIFWLIINLRNKTLKIFFNFTSKNLPYLFLIFLIFLQIIFGAFVSGLDAGKIYQNWPLMGKSYFPDDTEINNIKNFFDFNNQSLVQFYHRNLAYLIAFYIVTILFYIFKKKIRLLYKPSLILTIFLILQILLGIFTLVSGLNIYLASAHQISSVLLVFSIINLYYFHIK